MPLALPIGQDRSEEGACKRPCQEASPAGAVGDVVGLGVDEATGRRIPVAIQPNRPLKTGQ